MNWEAWLDETVRPGWREEFPEWVKLLMKMVYTDVTRREREACAEVAEQRGVVQEALALELRDTSSDRAAAVVAMARAAEAGRIAAEIRERGECDHDYRSVVRWEPRCCAKCGEREES